MYVLPECTGNPPRKVMIGTDARGCNKLLNSVNWWIFGTCMYYWMLEPLRKGFIIRICTDQKMADGRATSIQFRIWQLNKHVQHTAEFTIFDKRNFLDFKYQIEYLCICTNKVLILLHWLCNFLHHVWKQKEQFQIIGLIEADHDYTVNLC